jgi:hypothetical protein
VTRALIFFAAFFGAIVVPQLIAHGLNYLYPAQPRFGEDETALRATQFDLREMKNPIIAAVTAAGWQWRQVFFFSPPWLRWLHG